MDLGYSLGSASILYGTNSTIIYMKRSCKLHEENLGRLVIDCKKRKENNEKSNIFISYSHEYYIDFYTRETML